LPAVSIADLVSAGAVVATLAAIVVARECARRAFERRVSARLPVGPDGVIAGAEPIDLPAREIGARGALLLHGFGDTPQTLAYLARALHARGWSVRVPLLPGHGRTIGEWSRTRADDWLAHARRERDELRRTHDTVAIVGLSMGGALATLVTADAPNGATAPPTAAVTSRESTAAAGSIVCLVLLAPYFALPRWIGRMAAWHSVIGVVWPYLNARGDPSILDPDERDRSLAYGATTPRLVHELGTVARRAWAALPSVSVPTLLIQSHGDNRTSPAIATAAMARLTVTDKQLVWIDDGGHVITVDRGRDRVAVTVGEWLDAHAPGHTRARKVRPA
jgi:carboxylesterase